MFRNLISPINSLKNAGVYVRDQPLHARKCVKLATLLCAAVFALQTTSSMAQAAGAKSRNTPRIAKTTETTFADHAVPPYTGPRRTPSFTGENRNYSRFQTEIRRGFKSNPLFAGNFVLIGIGCGTGCMFALVGDVTTGRIFDFPLGGEEHYMMQYETRPTSRLVKVTWNLMSDGGAQCVKEELVLKDGSFERRQVGTSKKLCSW